MAVCQDSVVEVEMALSAAFALKQCLPKAGTVESTGKRTSVEQRHTGGQYAHKRHEHLEQVCTPRQPMSSKVLSSMFKKL